MTDAEKSNFIYCLACNYNLKDKAVRELCEIAEIAYPPRQTIETIHELVCEALTEVTA